jgi:extracellular factor (EF) 3-hydroxypalmitic acid methyl ester biosynthesis protein
VLQLNRILDHCRNRIDGGEGAEAVSVLCDELRSLVANVSPEDWTGRVLPVCRKHAIHELLLKDPYTSRAFHKPRGYAGDAELLDYVYRGNPPADTSAIGRAVFHGTTRLPNGRSVIFRRDLLAERINQAAGLRPRPRILSIACGHLREAQQSRAVMDREVQEFIAIDQDPQSLEVVSREQSSLGVHPVRGTVGEIVRKQLRFTDFDLVYAAGLFDYLSKEFSRRLLTNMVEMVRPGGRVLVANFTPDNHGRGYMECFMDWLLHCRDEREMEWLLGDIAPCQIASRELYRDAERNVIYLELVKA